MSACPYQKLDSSISVVQPAQNGVPVAFFFEGAPSVLGAPQAEGTAPSPAYVTDFLTTSDGLVLTKAFTRIKNAKLRRRIVDHPPPARTARR
jgi:hypothetical protein